MSVRVMARMRVKVMVAMNESTKVIDDKGDGMDGNNF